MATTEQTQPITLKVSRAGWQRAAQHLTASKMGAKIFAKLLPMLDRPLLKLTNERYSTAGLLGGVPTIMLTTTGAKSGQPRRMPLIATPDGDRIVLVASNWGQSRNPAWYYNLRKNPQATVEYGGQKASYIAHEVTDPAEYERLWQKVNQVYLGYEKYRKWADERTIPLMVLEPVQ
jgi:deazaflavin-dependent oxidoreductase (nitroreductase family)